MSELLRTEFSRTTDKEKEVLKISYLIKFAQALLGLSLPISYVILDQTNDRTELLLKGWHGKTAHVAGIYDPKSPYMVEHGVSHIEIEADTWQSARNYEPGANVEKPVVTQPETGISRVAALFEIVSIFTGGSRR